MVSAWKDDTPAAELLPRNIARTISPMWRTCMKRVRMEKYRPTIRHR